MTRIMLVLGVAALAAMAEGDGRRGRTNASLNGIYGFTAQGFTVAGSPVPRELRTQRLIQIESRPQRQRPD
jgi:hypothetical protein